MKNRDCNALLFSLSLCLYQPKKLIENESMRSIGRVITKALV